MQKKILAMRSSVSVEVMRKSSGIISPIVAQSQKVKLGLNFFSIKVTWGCQNYQWPVDHIIFTRCACFSPLSSN